MSKRLGIFVFYDKEGIVDDYILFLLSQMAEVLDKLVIVSNKQLPCSEKQKLCAFTDKIYERENKGFDAGAYKDTICKYIGWNKVYEYDELVLFNDTFYGFFIPAYTIFNNMNSKKCDFWGITMHHTNQYVQEHIQSYFLVVRNKMLHDKVFYEYWENYNYPVDLAETVKTFEINFTQHFSSQGFSYASFVDTTIWKDKKISNNFNYQSTRQYKLLSECNCPVLKKKNIATYVSDFANDASKSIEYIAKHTKYDTDLIFNNLLRLYEISDLNKTFNFVVNINDFSLQTNTKYKLCICCFLNYKQNLNELVNYLDNIKNIKAEIYIFTKSKAIHKKLLYTNSTKNINAKCFVLSNTDNPFFIINQKSDFYLFLTDKLLQNENVNFQTADKIRINNFDSLIKNETYLQNLLCYLENNKTVGIAMPENVELKLLSTVTKWEILFPKAKKALDEFQMSYKISSTTAPFIFSNCFCAKHDAIKQLFSHHPKNLNSFFELLPYMLIYLAQSNNLLSIKIGNTISTSRNNSLVTTSDRMLDYKRNFIHEQQIILNPLKQDLNNFYDGKEHIFIYGTGIWGERMAKFLLDNELDFDGFVVTDGENKKELFFGKNVFFLSELLGEKNIGFILALSENKRKDVVEILKRNKFNDYF